MKSNLLYIITSEPCPNGMAGTNRVLSHAKGLNKLGVSVKILVFRSTEKKDNGNHSQSLSDHLEIIYLTSPVISKNFFYRRWNNFIGGYRTFNYILQKPPPLAILYYASELYLILFLKMVCLFRKILLIREVNEHPLLFGNRLEKTIKYFANYHLFSPFDGMLLMTKYLVNWYMGKGWPPERLIEIPMSVDIERFRCILKPEPFMPYFFYCGYIGSSKDGIDIMLEAFRCFRIRYPEMRLIIAGDGPERQKFEDWCVKNKLSEVVEFLGYVSPEKIPYYVCNAHGLIMARPQSRQADAGFPTKLGEYLASGRPVIVSRVGEISLYLEDNINAYLFDPGNIDQLVEKMFFLYENQETSKEVGLNGFRVAQEKFNNIILSGRLLQWLDTHNKNNNT